MTMFLASATEGIAPEPTNAQRALPIEVASVGPATTVLPEASHRESSYQLRGLRNGSHTVVAEVVSGTLGIDSLEVTEPFRK